MKVLIDIWLDGYTTPEEHKRACLEFIEAQLDFSGSSVKVLWVENEKEKPQ